MKLYILLGHPDKNSFNGKIFSTYVETAKKLGHEIQTQCLGELTFDPILWKGYKEIQELESDLKKAQEYIKWCDKWVIIYPIWWGNIPALLKGFIDRILYSGFAFKYHEKDPFWDKLLKGRSAQLITTSDAPNLWIWWQYRNSDLFAMKKATLEFCGITPVKVKRIDRLRYRSQTDREKILEQVKRLVEPL